MTDKALPSLYQLTPMNPAFQADPHALLDDLRTRCPVRRDEQAGTFLLTRYEDVRGLVSDRTLWRDPIRAEEASQFARGLTDKDIDPDNRTASTSILLLDDPDHARVRQPLMQAFYARVAKFRPEIERIVGEHLDRLEGRESFDLMDELCVPVPVDVIAAILGVDHERLVEFREWSEGTILGLNPLRSPEQEAVRERCSTALSDYFTQTIEARRANPRDDLISDMTRLQAAGEPLNDTELRINLGALLVGGNLTTTDLIGNAVRLLLLNPDQLSLLKANPDLIKATIEETLRHEGPVDVTGRIASRDLEIGGCPVKTTQSITFSLKGANHDPAVFEDPQRFDIQRKAKPHVAFGGGAHICIGAPLARLEAQVAVAMIFERFPDLALAHPDEAPVWRALPFFRGLEHLQVLSGT